MTTDGLQRYSPEVGRSAFVLPSVDSAMAMPVLHILAMVMCLLVLSHPVWTEEYTGVASVFHFGMGARPLSLGGAFTAIADDVNALCFNPAGIAWLEGISVESSYAPRTVGANYGSLAVCLPHVGIAIQYLNFGSIQAVDDSGEPIGYFSHSSFGLSGSFGVRLRDLPLLTEWRGGDKLALGLRVKAYVARTVKPASGAGAAIDIPMLFRGESRLPGSDTLVAFGVGALLENVISWPIRYGSGHTEDWPLGVVLGASATIGGQIIAAVDIGSDKAVRVGLEWSPAPSIALRGGVRYEGLWVWSLGVGIQVDHFSIDLAYVGHRELGAQIRGSLAINVEPRNRRSN